MAVAPPAGSGLTTLAPRQGDTRQLSLKKINAILAGGGGQPPAFVQTANSGNGVTANSRGVLFAGAQTAGNLNVIVIGFGNSSGPSIANLINSVTDTLGNTYTPANSWLTLSAVVNNQAFGQIIYCAPNIKAAGAGANTVTVICSATVEFFTIAAFEYSGLALTGPVDVTAAQKQDSPAAITASSGSLTTTAANDTLFGAIACFDGPAASDGLTAGFTSRAKYYTELIADQVGVAVGPYSMSANSSGTLGWVAQMIALKAHG